jgi:hypothetical protein
MTNDNSIPRNWKININFINLRISIYFKPSTVNVPNKQISWDWDFNLLNKLLIFNAQFIKEEDIIRCQNLFS